MIASPLPTLRGLARTVRVGDVIAQPLWSLRPRQPAWEAAAAPLGVDEAVADQDPIHRRTRRQRVDAGAVELDANAPGDPRRDALGAW